MILFIMRCRPSAFLIHVRISSTKQIFTLDLIFVAHNSCGQNWVIFLIRQSFYFKKEFVPRGSNEKQDVKINLIQMVWNLGRCIWSKNYDFKIAKGNSYRSSCDFRHVIWKQGIINFLTNFFSPLRDIGLTKLIWFIMKIDHKVRYQHRPV